MRFEVTGDVQGVGERKHVIKSTDSVRAWEKFRQAYPGCECTLCRVKGLAEDAA